MSTQFVWTISGLNKDSVTNAVIEAHWKAYAVDGDNYADFLGTVVFNPNPESSEFIPYANIQVDTVVQWVKDSLGAERVEEIQDSLALQIVLKQSSTIIAVTPWTVDELINPPLELTEDQKESLLKTDIISKTQERLDYFAQMRGYDNIHSACGYITSTFSVFAEEGTAATIARDMTWVTLYKILDEVNTGVRQKPTCYEDVEELLPELQWSR